MAQREFVLDEFEKGNLIAWNVTTQCRNAVNVKLMDGNKTLFDKDKTTPSQSLQLLGDGHAVLESGSELKLLLDIPRSSNIKYSLVAGAISDRREKRVGYIYDFCIEDQYDDDYNDVYINVVGWKAQ